jgi:hypothetical protein
MSETTMLWILGIGFTITWGILGWIKMDISSLWNRADSHGHVVLCKMDDCKPRTNGVILKEGKE